MGSGTGYIEKFPVVIIASRAENEVISSAADVFGEFGAGNGDFSRAECGADEFGAGNGDFFRAELCNGAFRADMAADSRSEGMALAMQEPQKLQERQVQDLSADQLIWE